jgi:uncharacterized protein (DUF2147 family)
MRAPIKSPLVTMIAIASLTAFLSDTASAAEPYGVWVRPSTGTQVHFYDCGGKLCGKIVAVKDQSRSKEIGTVIMKGAVKSGGNIWKGDLLDVESGKIYSGVVTLEGPQRIESQRMRRDDPVPRRDLEKGKVTASLLVTARNPR